MYYSLYRYIIAINHFNNRIFLVENLLEGEESRIEEVKSLLRNRSLGAFQFMPLIMKIQILPMRNILKWSAREKDTASLEMFSR